MSRRTYGSWARDAIGRIAVDTEPATDSAAVVALVLQAVAESGLDPHHLGARFNPANTTMRRDRSWNFNAVGVQNYPNYVQGLDAWEATIRLHYYSEFLDALRHSNNPGEIVDLLEASPWGTRNVPRDYQPKWARFTPLLLQ